MDRRNRGVQWHREVRNKEAYHQVPIRWLEQQQEQQELQDRKGRSCVSDRYGIRLIESDTSIKEDPHTKSSTEGSHFAFPSPQIDHY